MEILGCFGVGVIILIFAVILLLGGDTPEGAALFGLAVFFFIGCGIMMKMEKTD
jgi:hypothetical protein